jgi:hypothetical protein
MRTALEREGRTALSVDLRPCELGGMHAQLDVRLILPLRHWERAFLFPPCFQQLRQDQDCLPLKIADGRAYWGCATVSGARVRRRISSLLSSPIQYSLTAGRALSQACAHRSLQTLQTNTTSSSHKYRAFCCGQARRARPRRNTLSTPVQRSRRKRPGTQHLASLHWPQCRARTPRALGAEHSHGFPHGNRVIRRAAQCPWATTTRSPSHPPPLPGCTSCSAGR